MNGFKPINSKTKLEARESPNFKPFVTNIQKKDSFREHSYLTKRSGVKMELRNGR